MRPASQAVIIRNPRPPCEPARYRVASAEADGQGEAGGRNLRLEENEHD
jgi:hypothetical protein